MAFIRPSFMDNMSWEMAEVYGAITDQILINLARYFPYFKAGNVPKSAFEYQANMLAQMGQVNADTVRIIRNGLGGANQALSHVLEQAIIESVKKSQPDLLKAVKAGILKPAGVPIVAPTQMRAFSLYYQQAAQKLNLVNTVMLESTKQAYQATVADIANRVQVVQTALDIGAGETITGVSTWNQALRHSINRMKENGVVGFIDHGGHKWSAEAYTAMDIRTTVANTARAAVWETNQDFGNDLYIVSYHDGARPLCYPWQNKVISSTNNARTVQDLDGNEIEVIAQSDTSYGEAAGLFGINCKHYPSPFIPGVSVMYDSAEIPSEKENEKIYEQTQQQRGLERKLREEKRDLLMAKEMGADADEIKALRAKCRETSDEIDKFCEETGLPRRQNREGVFTQRSFPDKDTYDPALFERQQQEEINKYFSNGGTQTGYSFGQMTPNAPVVPQTPIPAPVAQNVAPQVTQSMPPVVQSQAAKSVADIQDFAELKKHMVDTYGIDITSGVKQLEFSSVREAVVGFETVAKDVPEVAEAIQKMRVSSSGVMSCNGSNITFNRDYFGVEQAQKERLQRAFDFNVRTRYWIPNASAGSIGAHETAHAIEQVLIDLSGKYHDQMSKVLAWNGCYEARDVVNEAIANILQTPFGAGKTPEQLIETISRYAMKNRSETMAEAFADCFANGDNANPLSKEIRRITLERYRTYKGVMP